jgi:hypothetical protein
MTIKLESIIETIEYRGIRENMTYMSTERKKRECILTSYCNTIEEGMIRHCYGVTKREGHNTPTLDVYSGRSIPDKYCFVNILISVYRIIIRKENILLIVFVYFCN